MALQDCDLHAGLRQIAGDDRAMVAAADNDCIVVRVSHRTVPQV